MSLCFFFTFLPMFYSYTFDVSLYRTSRLVISSCSGSVTWCYRILKHLLNTGFIFLYLLVSNWQFLDFAVHKRASGTCTILSLIDMVLTLLFHHNRCHINVYSHFTSFNGFVDILVTTSWSHLIVHNLILSIWKIQVIFANFIVLWRN